MGAMGLIESNVIRGRRRWFEGAGKGRESDGSGCAGDRGVC